jgi:hypothetical protein
MKAYRFEMKMFNSPEDEQKRQLDKFPLFKP